MKIFLKGQQQATIWSMDTQKGLLSTIYQIAALCIGQQKLQDQV